MRAAFTNARAHLASSPVRLRGAGAGDGGCRQRPGGERLAMRITRIDCDLLHVPLSRPRASPAAGLREGRLVPPGPGLGLELDAAAAVARYRVAGIE